MPKIAVVSLIAVTLTLALGAQTPQTIPPPGSKAPVSGYTVVRSFPHDPKAFTQGLEYFDGYLYEGTGQKGQSAARKIELESGKVVQEEKLHPQYFGEGLTIAQGKIFQVTWKDRQGFIYDAKTMKFIRNFTYFGEGWGLTHDPLGIIMSDGTSTLRFLETTRFQEKRRLKVVDAGVAIWQPERARDDSRRDLGERVADRLHREDFAQRGARAGLDQSQRVAGRAQREDAARCSAQWHCI
jgi:glutamine cyclotransferase